MVTTLPSAFLSPHSGTMLECPEQAASHPAGSLSWRLEAALASSEKEQRSRSEDSSVTRILEEIGDRG